MARRRGNVPVSRIVKVGGGGNERFMILVPIGLIFFFSIYALGGPGQTLVILENYAQSALLYVRYWLR